MLIEITNNSFSAVHLIPIIIQCSNSNQYEKNAVQRAWICTTLLSRNILKKHLLKKYNKLNNSPLLDVTLLLPLLVDLELLPQRGLHHMVFLVHNLFYHHHL